MQEPNQKEIDVEFKAMDEKDESSGFLDMMMKVNFKLMLPKNNCKWHA